MDKRNIIIPIKLPETKLTLDTTPVNIFNYFRETYPDWYSSHKDKFNICNSIRLYAFSGDFGILIDGNDAAVDNAMIVAEGIHFIENVSIDKVSLIGLASGTEVVVQIGLIG